MLPTLILWCLQRLKAVLWYSVGQITDHEALEGSLAGTGTAPHNATPQFIGALTELAWAQVQSAGRDLEEFARHAGRGTVQVEDVLLLARRNEGLEGLLRTYADEVRAESRAKKQEQQRTAGGRSGGGGAAAKTAKGKRKV
jgi:centromere protein S